MSQSRKNRVSVATSAAMGTFVDGGNTGLVVPLEHRRERQRFQRSHMPRHSLDSQFTAAVEQETNEALHGGGGVGVIL